MIRRLKQLTNLYEQGISHIALPLIATVVVGCVGVFSIVASHAETVVAPISSSTMKVTKLAVGPTKIIMTATVAPRNRTIEQRDCQGNYSVTVSYLDKAHKDLPPLEYLKPVVWNGKACVANLNTSANILGTVKIVPKFRGSGTLAPVTHSAYRKVIAAPKAN